MTLQWTSNDHTLITAELDNLDTQHLISAIETSLQKAIELLPTTIQDDSLYFLIQWNSSQQHLTIVVTDESKSHDSPPSVTLAIKPAIENTDAFVEDLMFYSKDFLATCNEFMNFSLVAALGVNTRDKLILL